MSTRRLLVAGAGGGIGRAFVDQLAGRDDVARVYALHRHPVSTTSEKVTWLQADLTSETCLERAADAVEQPLHGLIFAAGLLHAGGLRPEKSLRQLDAGHLQQAYAVNAAAPLLMLKHFSRHLVHPEPSFAAFLSAKVGSIGDNRLGGWYGYRMAKAALNMGIATAAIELDRSRGAPVVVAVHPGTVRTALSGPFVGRRSTGGRAPGVLDPDAAAARLLDVFDRLGPEQQGAFLNYDGTRLPW